MLCRMNTQNKNTLSNSQYKVLAVGKDPLPKVAIDIFESKGYQVHQFDEHVTEVKINNLISQYHVLCLGNDCMDLISDEILGTAHKLLAIGIFQQKLPDISSETTLKMGIPIFFSSFAHSYSVAEMVIGLIISLARELSDRNQEIHNQLWFKKSNGCFEIRGKTLGIIGYSHVGSQLGVLAEAMGMHVIYFDHSVVMPLGRTKSAKSLQDVLENADFLSLNLSAQPENDNLIKAKELNMMKKGSYIINCGYEKAICITDLKACLQSKHIAGAAIDVIPDEPTEDKTNFKHPFANLKNVILTPRISRSTIQAHHRAGSIVATNIANFLSHGNFNPLNPLIKKGSTVGALNYPNIDAGMVKESKRRIVNMHYNVRGVLQEIDHILSGYNLTKQVLDTNAKVGYLIADVNADEVTADITSSLALLANSIRTRII